MPLCWTLRHSRSTNTLSAKCRASMLMASHDAMTGEHTGERGAPREIIEAVRYRDAGDVHRPDLVRACDLDPAQQIQNLLRWTGSAGEIRLWPWIAADRRRVWRIICGFYAKMMRLAHCSKPNGAIRVTPAPKLGVNFLDSQNAEREMLSSCVAFARCLYKGFCFAVLAGA